MSRRRNIIETVMKKYFMVFFFLTIIVAFGIYALPNLNKNEFPDVTIRTGVVAVVYPGATAEEIEQQCARQVENFLFTFRDVKKTDTYSYSRDGMLYVFVTLVADVENAPVTWSRIRQGLQQFRMTDLPQGVIATAVVDDFGNASSLLLAIESNERSSRELRKYIDILSDRLRDIKTMGNIKIVGEQKEEIAVLMDPARMTQYAVSPSMVSAELALHGVRTLSAKADNPGGQAVVHVAIPYSDMYDLSELVIFSEPQTHQAVRLRDVATLERRYQEGKPYIQYSDSSVTDNPCLMLSLEMRSGNNVVAFGREVDKQIAAFLQTCPPDIRVHRITDQPKNVSSSVRSFLKDLVEAVLVVILVMLMLFPFRTALVSSTSVPVCIAATFGIMYLVGMELNTVTLAALIVVLGMIVDDSVVVIDGYTDLLEEGHSRWYSAAVSTKSLLASMFISTCSISGMFFPMLPTLKGSPIGDFIRLFPWAIFIALTCSFLYAIWVIPYMSARLIRKQSSARFSFIEKVQVEFFGWMQRGYSRLITLCFRYRWTTVAVAGLSVLAGAFFFTRLNVEILPKAERDSFAVEIHLAAGSSLAETQAVVDSLSHVLMRDERVVSVTKFVGMSSPRFHLTYTPQLASDSYAQFIVNTVSNNATKELMLDYPTVYENHFPQAQIRFKQMDYMPLAAPVEFRLKADTYAELEPYVDSIKAILHTNPHLAHILSDYDESEEVVEIVLDTDEASRMGITQSGLSVYLSGALRGSQLSSHWEGSYNLPIKIYTEGVHDINYEDIGDILVPTARPGEWVPVHQIATLHPVFQHKSLPHRNGRRCVSIRADVLSPYGQMAEHVKMAREVEKLQLPETITCEIGGIIGNTRSQLPPIGMAVGAAILVMFLVLLIHYGKIGISVLTITQSLICIFGACFGLWLFDCNFGITAILGLISLIGIIVRNGIIMYDYANELVEKQHMSVHEAAMQAGLRRMRPIFLTSATTALGVIPMIAAKTMLWMPMGVVICVGTLITLPLVLTVLPITYCMVFERNERQNARLRNVDNAYQGLLNARDEALENYNKKRESK